MEHIYYPSHDGVTTLHACIWKPEGEIKGVVQIIHGMSEYAERYSPFAEYLNRQGYLVCADDHLGHGRSVVSKEELGYINKQRDVDIVLSDIRALNLAVKKQTEGKPYFVLGHSMGSFICRKYISLYGKELSGAVIMGTGYKDQFTLTFALCAVRVNALLFGWKHRSKLLTKLAFGNYNKKFRPARTQNDWLSKDTQNVDNYEKDELCGFTFTDNGYHFLFSIIKQACSSKVFDLTPKKLPLYLVSGALDPVGDYGKGVIKARDKFIKYAVKDVNMKLYEDCRHEILNDECKQQVMDDILAFIQSHSGDKNG